jgi:hypothetical protein
LEKFDLTTRCIGCNAFKYTRPQGVETLSGFICRECVRRMDGPTAEPQPCAVCGAVRSADLQ